MKIRIEMRNRGRTERKTDIDIDDAHWNNMTCGEFLGRYAEQIISEFGMSHQIKTLMPTSNSFQMNLVEDDGTIKFDNLNKDKKIAQYVLGPQAVFYLDYLERGYNEESDYTNNVTPAIPTPVAVPAMQSRFPQRAQKNTHIALLHRLDRLLENYTK